MLQAILDAIAQAKGPVSLHQLSAQLGIDEQALAGMIEHLIQKGYLQRSSAQAGQHCDCPLPANGACPGPESCPFVYHLPQTFRVHHPSS